MAKVRAALLCAPCSLNVAAKPGAMPAEAPTSAGPGEAKAALPPCSCFLRTFAGPRVQAAGSGWQRGCTSPGVLPPAHKGPVS